MKNSTPTAPITDNDRLGLTLFLAVVVHGILILGLSLKELSDHLNQQPPTLNVLLLQTSSNQAPKQAAYIAQTNEVASGTSNRSGHPGNLFFALNDNPSNGVAPNPQPASTAHTETQNRQRHVLTSTRANYSLSREAHAPAPQKQVTPENQHLIRLQLEQARITSELRRAINNYNHKPRRLFLDTVNAKTAVEASYLAHWVQRVERIGNLNYPAIAIRNRLHGSLILNVLISHTGKVLHVIVVHSSGSLVLDDAAKRIVHLASPFPPFPAALRKHYDQLMITRTWVFETEQPHVTDNH